MATKPTTESTQAKRPATKSSTPKPRASAPRSARKAADAEDAAKPAKKTSTRYRVGRPPTGKGATSKVVKGSDKLPPIPGAEIKVTRSNSLHRGAEIARRGKKGMLTNEQRRLLARAVDGLSPLEFATSVLRDEEASISSRRWAAEVLMPYLHHRLPTVQINQNNNTNAGVLVAPAQLSPEEWIAQYGAQPADVVDIEFNEVPTLTEDDNA